MCDLDGRLAAIFGLVFPGLRGEAALEATRDSVPGWDSIATVTLFTLVEEEFGKPIDPAEAAEWTSFSRVRAAVQKELDG